LFSNREQIKSRDDVDLVELDKVNEKSNENFVNFLASAKNQQFIRWSTLAPQKNLTINLLFITGPRKNYLVKRYWPLKSNGKGASR
jgi:hypothetical protein